MWSERNVEDLGGIILTARPPLTLPSPPVRGERVTTDGKPRRAYHPGAQSTLPEHNKNMLRGLTFRS